MTQPLAAYPVSDRSSVPPHLRPSAARAAAAARVLGAAPPPLHGAAALELHPDLAPAAPGERRHLQVVEEPGRTPAQRRRRARAMLIGGAAVMMAVAFALVYLHVLLAQRQFKIDRLNTQVSQEQASYQQLRLQVAQLGSPQHVISTAEGQLGMTQPAKVTYISPTVTIAGTTTGTGTGTGWTGSAAPAGTQGLTGDADWPLIKSQLAGSS